MRFTTPLALFLLLLIPYFIWLARPRADSRRRSRAWLTLLLRLTILVLLTLGLAGTQMVRAADELAVVFLVDASDSISADESARAEQFVRAAMAEMGPDDAAALVVFGANALVDRPMSGLADLAPISSVPQPLHSDLAEAIRLGLALFPAGSARRMVLLSDGVATTGDFVAAAEVAAAAGVPIEYVPLAAAAAGAEAWLVAVNAPTQVVAGETFAIDVQAESTAAMPATLRVLAGGSILHQEEVALREGNNNFSVSLAATDPAFARYTVELVPFNDTFYQNNRLAAYTEVVGPPRILLVAAGEGIDESGAVVRDESVQLRLALEGAGLPVERVTPAELPASLAELANYATVVLVNVNAKDLSPRKMETLQRYVRELGGGLVAVGGPTSYGMGGYFRTPLEEALPVDMQIKDQERFPSVSIVIVIDRSGSMAMPEGGLTKIQLADEAAVRVVELLNDFDEITVIPVDTQPDNPIGPVSAADKAPIIDEIRQIGAGGGGINVRTGVQAAADALTASTNTVKHVIVLADGNDSNEQTGVPELIAGLVAEGTTVSMVAIGSGKDVPWLQEMAELGQGRFYLTNEAANLPQIFTQETTSIQRTYLVEERFFPQLSRRSPILANIETVPPLHGYVGTSSKQTAQVILETHLGDPLLASWQYGLGRAVAWTSDATGRWARDWVRWAGFPTFWAQTVRWSITEGQKNVETAVVYGEERALLTVDVRGDGGEFANDLNLTANVVAPDGTASEVPIKQVAPGRYQGDFVPEQEGAYLIRVNGAAADPDAVVAQTTGWVLGYSPEYRRLEADPEALESIAALTGGRAIGDDPAAAFAHTLTSDRTTRPIWPWLLFAAVTLLPFDIASRRLLIGAKELHRAWRRIRGRQPAPATPERAERVARLFAAKRRATSPAKPAEAAAPAAAEPAAPTPPAPTPPSAQQGAATTREEKAAPPSPDEAAASAQPLASRLLARRQQRREDEAED